MIFVVSFAFDTRNATWRCAVELVNCMAWELAAVFDRTGKQVARVQAGSQMRM
jgi:hypothetical protein